MDWWDHQDRLLRQCRTRLGESVVIFFPGADASGNVVEAIFDTPRARSDLGLVLELSNQGPVVHFRVVDLPNAETPEQGWQFEARGALWEIVDVEPDGGGAVRCRCFRVGPGSLCPLPPLTPELVPPVALRDDVADDVDLKGYA